MDTDSAWSKSGYRGWVQGYRLVLQGLVFPAPVPLFARWCSNAVGESTVLEEALAAEQLPVTELLLGDSTFGGADLVATYALQGGWLLTPQQLPANPESWKHDLYAYRRETIELLFQRIIQACDLKACPTKGLARTGTFVIASVWLYQVLFLDNHRHHSRSLTSKRSSMKDGGALPPELRADQVFSREYLKNFRTPKSSVLPG